MSKLEVKVGDSVHLSSRYRDDIVTVKKVTPTGIIKIEEFPYMSFTPSGRERGAEPFSTCYIKVLTEETAKRIKSAAITRYLGSFKWGELDEITKETVYKLVKGESNGLN